MNVDLLQMAQRMLADFDARTPNALFADPPGLSTIQAEVARLRERRGEKVIGYKVGCTSSAVQHQLGIGEPIYARLFDSVCLPCGAKLSCQSYANLAIEGELAVRLGQDVSSTIDAVQDCRAAIASAFPVVELHHYVLRSPKPSHVELIASGGMHAGFVLAEQEPQAGLRDFEHLNVCIDGERVGTIAGSEVTALALRSVRWLARRLAESGLTLNKAHVVLTGSLLPLYPVKPGSSLTVDGASCGSSSALIVQ